MPLPLHFGDALVNFQEFPRHVHCVSNSDTGRSKPVDYCGHRGVVLFGQVVCRPAVVHLDDMVRDPPQDVSDPVGLFLHFERWLAECSVLVHHIVSMDLYHEYLDPRGNGYPVPLLLPAVGHWDRLPDSIVFGELFKLLKNLKQLASTDHLHLGIVRNLVTFSGNGPICLVRPIHRAVEIRHFGVLGDRKRGIADHGHRDPGLARCVRWQDPWQISPHTIVDADFSVVGSFALHMFCQAVGDLMALRTRVAEGRTPRTQPWPRLD